MATASWTPASQAAFAAALMEPAIPASAGFNVHRNTVLAGLVRALAEGFPSVESLVGPTFFAAMAAVAVRARPPSHPVLLAYGAGFAGFLEQFEPVAALPYLADVARLDGLRRRAWHAADVAALEVDALKGIDPDHLAARRITLHPSLGLLASVHPARTLWAAQNGEAAPEPLAWTPQTTAVWRQHRAIRVEAVDAGRLDLLAVARDRPTLARLLEADNPMAAQARAHAFARALRDGLLVDADALDLALATVPDATLFDPFLPPFPTTADWSASP